MDSEIRFKRKTLWLNVLSTFQRSLPQEISARKEDMLAPFKSNHATFSILLLRVELLAEKEQLLLL